MISDEISDAIDSRNADFMDLVIPLKTGDTCPYLVKFYGALHAEVVGYFELFFSRRF